MLSIIIFFTVIASVIVLSSTVVKDGLGSRPGPRSHEDHDQHSPDAVPARTGTGTGTGTDHAIDHR